jgi:uncharacterized 2Fe-2S/4Fe-4S cluster protein (DUF4445 family)
LIALADALHRAGWIDRRGTLTAALPDHARVDGRLGRGVALSTGGEVALWERDLMSLLRTKGAIFSGMRALVDSLGESVPLARVVVSGNLGRFLNLSAAIGIGLLPDLPLERYAYLGNGSLEGAALALLSRSFLDAAHEYLARVTYVDLSELPGYFDEFTSACFLPHTTPERLRLG